MERSRSSWKEEESEMERCEARKRRGGGQGARRGGKRKEWEIMEGRGVFFSRRKARPGLRGGLDCNGYTEKPTYGLAPCAFSLPGQGVAFKGKEGRR